jgi:hypothetical protein
MKKQVRKLVLAKETLRQLANRELDGKIYGGTFGSAIDRTCNTCPENTCQEN